MLMMMMMIMMMIMTKLVICIFFAFSDIFSCVLLQLMHYVDVCCWDVLGWVGSGMPVVGWVIENGSTAMSAPKLAPRLTAG